jgi:FHS family glucose/mannose:H+ symporter-like MFS transporter
VLRHRLLVYIPFTATGVGLALPGALMPWLLTHWMLRDEQVGLLLFLFFLGSTAGAFLLRGTLTYSIARGCLLAACGVAWLPLASSHTAYAAMAIYGVGLGITMTSASLLQSRRFADDCAAEMTRLNLLWAVGAVSAPYIALRRGIADSAHATHMLFVLAAVFAVCGVLVALFEAAPPATQPVAATTRKGWLIHAPLPLLLLAFCITGVEASSGGWLATYSQRSGHLLQTTIGAPTCFWAGLLFSRLLHSSGRVSSSLRRFLLSGNLLLLTAALAALLLFQSAAVLLIAAFFVGFAAGPMYPLLLALVLEHDNSPSVFILAGAGSAALPYLTGLLSTATHSLRSGLAVPAFAAAAMLMAGLITLRAEKPNGRTARLQ